MLLAVSGGADSTALLYFWAKSAAAVFGCNLAVVHIHHGLRAASAADRDFVVAACRELDLPLYAYDLDPTTKPVRTSTEMWARDERYRLFSEAAIQAGATWIATAHQRDDLVETVFQRLGRGTGPRGLAGIPFRREPGIVRPFLNRSRAEILEYLNLRKVSWREDESNTDTRINRNWYRHRYLPRLRETEGDLDERIFQMAMQVQSMGNGLDALEDEAALLFRDDENRPALSLAGMGERLVSGDWESLTYWVRALIRMARPDDPTIEVTREILDEMARQWQREPGRLQVFIARNLALKTGNHGIYCQEWTPGPSAKKPCPPDIQRVILWDAAWEAIGSTASEIEVGWRWESRAYKLWARRYPKPPGLTYPASGEGRAIFDADRFSCTLVVRSRRAGDCFSPFGVCSRFRKLKVFFNEKKVPVGMRDSLPIFLSDETLAWVPGYGISDFYKVTEATSSILELVLTCENL